jgi:hypothetical protein
MEGQTKQLEKADKFCWPCEKKVKAERRRNPWRVGDLIVGALTAGLWIPIRMIYDAVASPWCCVKCGDRIEPRHKAMGRAAAYGFGGLMGAWVLIPGVIAVVSDQPIGFGGGNDRSAQQSKDAIAREQTRRVEAEARFTVGRKEIIGEIENSIAHSRFDEAIERARPYLFLDDADIARRNAYAKKKFEESGLLASAEKNPTPDLAGKVRAFSKLAEMDPGNATYRKRIEYYRAKALARAQQAAAQKAAAEERAAAEKKKLAAEETKRDAVVAEFGKAPIQSAWDDSYSEVEGYLKRIANDPDSIEIDTCTKVYQADDGWLVGCDYRGRNGFGGTIRQSN